YHVRRAQRPLSGALAVVEPRAVVGRAAIRSEANVFWAAPKQHDGGHREDHQQDALQRPGLPPATLLDEEGGEERKRGGSQKAAGRYQAQRPTALQLEPVRDRDAEIAAHTDRAHGDYH